MGKLLKYELKGIYKFMLMVLLTILGSSAIAQGSIYYLYKNRELINQDSSILIPFLIGISILVLWASFIVSFFYIVNNYNKELIDDRGYLTFSLPLKGRQILGSKVVSSLIAYFLLIFITGVFNTLLGIFFINKAGVNIFEEILKINLPVGFWKFVIILCIYSLISAICTLISIFFVMTIRKVIFGGRKYNFIWFIFFLILNGFVGLLSIKVMDLVPYYITVSDAGRYSIVTYDIFINTNSAGIFPPILNIGNILLSIGVGIVLFIITSLLLDKKVEI